MNHCPMGFVLWSISDVTVSKCHQQLDEILIYFYLHFIEELSKVVFTKTVSCSTPAELEAIKFAQHTLVINTQDMRTFHTAYSCHKWVGFWQSFLVNNVADFPYSADKKSRVHPVVGGVSLQHHLLFNHGSRTLKCEQETANLNTTFHAAIIFFSCQELKPSLNHIMVFGFLSRWQKRSNLVNIHL